MTKIANSLTVLLVVIAAGLQTIASAEEKKPAPPAKAAPAARPAPVVRLAPVARPAIAPQRAPVVRQAPITPRAPVTAVVPNAPARIVAPRTVSPTVTPNVAAPRGGAPRDTSTTGSAARAMSLPSIRGASRATIAGRNFSVWRGSHRVNRDGRWRTFVGLGALSAIFVGSSYYYPYAYIDASSDYCQGWTEDGCELSWQPVPTIEGDTDYQCVAYCPWR